MKEAPGSSETSVLTRATRRNNPEDTILQRPRSFVFYGNPSIPTNYFLEHRALIYIPDEEFKVLRAIV
jgi:hypothetical protein